MGIFSSSSDNAKSNKDMTLKSNRKVCWESRDDFFACLDKHDITDPNKNSKEASSKCGAQEKKFETDCIKSWVEHFKTKRVNELEQQRQIKLLEERGAIRLDSTPRFK